MLSFLIQCTQLSDLMTPISRLAEQVTKDTKKKKKKKKKKRKQKQKKNKSLTKTETLSQNIFFKRFAPVLFQIL